MERETTDPVELIDLGVATEETRGAEQGDVDFIGKIPMPGLSDD